MKILHVTECFDGGVSRAIESIADLYQGDHYLIFSGGEIPSKRFKDHKKLPSGILARINYISEMIDSIKPDIIHAHSSWAGVYTRCIRRRVPILYQPHCFAFDDPKRGYSGRLFFRLAEKLLSFRSRATIALSAHEEKLALSLNSKSTVLRLNNVATVEGPRVNALKDPLAVGSPLRIVMVGRIALQKDPEFFAEVARLARKNSKDWEFVWIGDGDEPSLKKLLLSENIRVTGWLDSNQLIDELSHASVYLHSASYEGFPLSVLDAAACHLPILARDINCFDEIEIDKISDTENAFDFLASVSTNYRLLNAMRLKSINLNTVMSPENQRQQLKEIYNKVKS